MATNAIPVIERVSSKIGTLERRAEHLRARLDRESFKGSTSADFDRAEVVALDAAVEALRYHVALLDDATSPVVALANLVAAVEDEGADDVEGAEEREVRAVAHARRVLALVGGGS